MTVKLFTSATQVGWPGVNKIKLPKFSGHQNRADMPIQSEEETVGEKPFQFVDVQNHSISTDKILWTDSISTCVGIALWAEGKAGLGHAIMDNVSKRANSLFEDFAARPRWLFFVSAPSAMATGIETQENLAEALDAAKEHYGELDDIKVRLVTGYGGINWLHECRLAVGPNIGVVAKLKEAAVVELDGSADSWTANHHTDSSGASLRGSQDGSGSESSWDEGIFIPTQ